MIFIDYESYYDKEYSLKEMPIDNYVLDERFHIHGVAIKANDTPSFWMSDEADIRNYFHYNDFSEDTIVAHNNYFDGFIAAHKFGAKPKQWLCTMCMGRGLFGPDVSNALDSLAPRLGFPGKSDDVKFTMGKRQLSPAELERLGKYAINDLDRCADCFNKMMKTYPPAELDLIDLTLRMFIEPTLELDIPMLEAYYEEEVSRKRQVLNDLEWLYPYASDGQLSLMEVDKTQVIRESLMSNDKFQILLQKLDIPFPTKRDGNVTFSKNEAAFKNMLKAKDGKTRQVFEARLAVKSTMGETRSQSFLDVKGDKFPIQLLYAGNHTLRWSGQGGRNPQNLIKNSPLRQAIKAPQGYVLVKADSSQIEARLTAFLASLLAGTESLLLRWFIEGKDPYCEFGTMFYGRTITKADEFDRFVSKQAVLGLGFQMSAPKFQWQMKSLADIDFDMDFCEHIVTFYRGTFPEIKQMWWKMQDFLEIVLTKGYKDMGFFGFDEQGIRLPSGLHIHYNDLQRHDIKKGDWIRTQYDYLGRVQGKPKRVNLFGGKVAENLIQGLDRQIVAEQMLIINGRYKVVHNEHDGLIALVPETEAEAALEWIIEVMSTPPTWAKDFPVTAEGKISERYG